MATNAHVADWPIPTELSDPVLLPRGFTIERGVRPPLVSFITTGRMRFLVQFPGGREVRLVDVSAGTAFGLASAILDEPILATMVVLESCAVRAIAAARMRVLVESDVRAARWSAHALAWETLRIETAVARFGTDAEMRLQFHLAELCTEGTTLAVDGAVRLAAAPSHKELAQAVGVSREYIGRLLAEAERCGWIRRERGRYLLPVGSPVLALHEALTGIGSVRQSSPTV